MSNQSMSITKALVELKVLDKRIQKAIDEIVFIMYKTKTKNFQVSEEEFRKSTIASYQSLNDMIERRDKIKNAIVTSNSQTIVEIADMKMTVAHAIEYKKTVFYKNLILDKMREQRRIVISEAENHKIRVQSKIDENIRVLCGKDGKPDANTIQIVTESITKSDPIDIFDPLQSEKESNRLDDFVSEFAKNIDVVLAESNARTIIDLSQ